MADKPESQADKFRAAARLIGCDEDEARWTARLKKVVKVNGALAESAAPDSK